jgi:hypothetical protein
VHYLKHEYPQIVANTPSLHSECDLLHPIHKEHQYLDPEAAAEWNEHYSQFTYYDNESDISAPEEQDFTIHSPHLSVGLTPVLAPETLSAYSGENSVQSTALRATTPSEERQGTSEAHSA